MKDLTSRPEFESAWEKAFLDAEMNPSDEVWTKIDAALANQEASRYKKKAFYYKIAAAASILLALSAGLWTIRQAQINEKEIARQEMNSHETAPVTRPADTSEVDGRADTKKAENTPIEETEGVLGGGENALYAMAPPVKKEIRDEIAGVSSLAYVDEPNIGATQHAPAQAIKSGIEFLDADLTPRKGYIQRALDPSVLFALLPKEKPGNVFWAGLAFTGGSFDPDFSGGWTGERATMDESFAQHNFRAPASSGRYNGWYNSLYDNVALANELNDPELLTPSIKESEPEISYSFGINFGGRFGKKWAYQSGVYYAKNVTSSSTSAVFVNNAEEKAYPVHVSNFMNKDNVYTLNYLSDVALNNNFEFISIPVKAGYIVYDRKVSLTLFSGISSDIFLSNRIDDGDEGLETVTVNAGSDSPYRTVWFNGLLSLELKYNLAGRYSAFVEPSYKISLNSLTRPDYPYESYPKTFSIGAGVKYNLR